MYEIEVEQQSSQSTATISARHKHSNSGKKFVALRVKTVTGPLAALGHVAVQLGAAGDTARVRIWANGYSR